MLRVKKQKKKSRMCLLTNNIAIETKQIIIYIKIRKNKLFYAS